MGIPQNERESPRIEPPPPTSTDRTQNYFRRKSTAGTDFTKRLWRALVRGYMLGRETDPWNDTRTLPATDRSRSHTRIRKLLGVKPGDGLVFEGDGTRTQVRPVKSSSPFEKFRGIGNGRAGSWREGCGTGDPGVARPLTKSNVFARTKRRNATALPPTPNPHPQFRRACS